MLAIMGNVAFPTAGQKSTSDMFTDIVVLLLKPELQASLSLSYNMEIVLNGQSCQ